MKSPSYDAAIRERAQREESYLVTFDFCGKYAKRGRLTMQGTMTPDEARELMQLVTERFGKRKQPAKKGA